MKFVRPSVKMEDNFNGVDLLKKIERIGRVCYKSEESITDDSYVNFIKGLLSRGHESVLEHVNLTARIICNRGVTHEIVRHRIASYSQESTRYCNYAKGKFGEEITLTVPSWVDLSELDLDDLNSTIECYLRNQIDRGFFTKKITELGGHAFLVFMDTMLKVENSYFKLLNDGLKPQDARGILPNELKTEIVMTMNLRKWRHFFKLRCDKAAHPEMREVANRLATKFKNEIPILFDEF